MTAIKQRAIDEIEKMPDDRIIYVIEIIRGINGLYDQEDSKKQMVMENQRKFVRETAGKIKIDEQAVNDLRMRSMI